MALLFSLSGLATVALPTGLVEIPVCSVHCPRPIVPLRFDYDQEIQTPPKTASPEEAAKKKSKLRKIGYVLVAVAALYFFLMLAQPKPR